MSEKDFYESMSDQPHDQVTLIVLAVPKSWSQARKDVIIKDVQQIIEQMQAHLNDDAPGVILWEVTGK